MTLAETDRFGYGYTTAAIPPTSGGARCEGPHCTKPATRLVTYYAGGKPRSEKLFCTGHAPDRGHTYRREVA